MINEIKNYFKLRRRLNKLEALKITKEQIACAELHIISDSIHDLDEIMFKEELLSFKERVLCKIGDMIDELENKPLD